MDADVKSAGILNDQTVALHNIIRIQFTRPIERLWHFCWLAEVCPQLISPGVYLCCHHHVNMIKLNKYLLIGLDSIVKWGRLLSFSWKNGKLIHFSNELSTLALCSKDHFIPVRAVSLVLCAADKTKRRFSLFYIHYLTRLLTVDSWRIFFCRAPKTVCLQIHR